jgi:hypothetical protein
MALEIDYFEYADDTTARAAYVTNAQLLPTSAYATGSNNLVSHFDGADGATAYSDPVKGAYTFGGGAQLDTAQYKWATASLLLDGTGDYVTTPTSTDWDFGAGDFTIDFWVRFNATTGQQNFLYRNKNINYTDYYQLYKPDGTTQLNFICAVGGSNKVNVHTPDGLFTAGPWYHIALVRSSTTMYIFVDGVSQSLTVTTEVSTNSLTGATGVFVIGGDINSNVNWVNGWIDEFRVLKGTAVWTSNFNDVLQSYSEATIKTQGSYALKAVATTGALNKTLTKTFATNKDLTGINNLKIDMRSTRTGANVKLGLHDTGGTTTELTPTINTAGEFETKTWDISAVADADKNAIDKFIITPTNADAANTVYFDNFYGFSSLDDHFDATVLSLTATLQGVTYRSDGTVSPSALNLALTLHDVICGHSIVVEGGALTLALWNPTIRIDSTVSPSVQTLTATLNAPTIRGDANVYPIAQALTLALQDPTYRGDSTFTATALELIATLNDPTVVWDSSFTATALTLTTTLHDGTPFVITRIIRRDYTFGVTEQVTHTKLNNLMDTAIWEISNQIAGDMFYLNSDEVWYRIPKGTVGQKMTMVDGIPAWA